MPNQSGNSNRSGNSRYLAPVPPKAGYRRGFEPRPGESDEERLKRELEELKRRARGRASGANYDHYKNAKGGSIKKMAKGGPTASKRADGCATKGKTKGRFV
jgi:hypothetical protein